MASILETKVFDTELHLKSYRNFFPELVPTAAEAFDELKTLFDNGQLDPITLGNRTVYIHDFVLNDDWITLLFHMTDPDVRDRDYSNIQTGTLRTAERLQGEAPAFSALTVLNKSNQFDQSRSYPFIIQEAQSLSRTVVTNAINTYFGQVYNGERQRAEQGDNKPFSIRGQLQAPLDQTIEGMLASGAQLDAIKIVEQTTARVVHGDEAYPLQEKRNFRLKVEGRPITDRARDILRTFYGETDRNALQSLKVILVDPDNETAKTVSVDLHDDNILNNAFIRKVLLEDFDEPLKECDEEIRADIEERMKELANVEAG